MLLTKSPLRPSAPSGFTLIEVMIAIGILAIGMGAILTAESNSLDVTVRAKRMTTVAMLAKNALIEAERELAGKTFLEVRTDQSGKFDAPYSEYTWTRKVKEITFPNLLNPQASGGAGTQGGGSAADGPQKIDANVERIVKVATQYLSKSTRELDITISWKEKGKDQSFSVSQYWVDLNHEFDINAE